MAFPQVEAVFTRSPSGSVHNFNLPEVVNAGDLLIVCAVRGDSGGAFNSFPDGDWSWWAGNSPVAPVYRRVADGSEGGGVVSFGMSGATAAAAVVFKVPAGSWYGDFADGAFEQSGSGSGTSVNPLSVNPSQWDVEDTLVIAVGMWQSTAGRTGIPVGYTDLGISPGGVSPRVTAAYRNITTASEDPGPFTINSSSGWFARTFAVRPRHPQNYELVGGAELAIQGQGRITGGLAELVGGAGLAIQGEAGLSALSLLSGTARLGVHGSGDIVISDYTFRWSLGYRQARLDHGFPTVYVEISSIAMPSGPFPEGQFFEDRLKDFPELNESSLSTRYGITGFQAVTLELSNADGLLNALDLQDAYVRIFILDGSGSAREFKGQVSEWTQSLTCVATVEDVDALVLSGTLPRRTLNDIAEAEKLVNPSFTPVADDLGKPVPVIFGRAVAVPLLFLKADDADREYDYVIGEGQGLSGWFEEVFTVYWGEEALDSIEGVAAAGSASTLTLETADRRPQSWYKWWWIDIVSGTGASGPSRATTAYDSALNRVTVSPNFSPAPSAGSGYELTEYLFFDGSQASPYPGVAFIRLKKRLGTSGRNAQMFADVNGFQAETNPARAIQSVLSNDVWGLGLDVDGASLDAAAALLEDLKCEGAVVRQTGTIDVINELLAFRDMVLSKDGAIKIEVDQAKASAHHFGLGDEKGRNNIMTEEPAIRRLHTEQKVKNLKVRYRRNNREQDVYLHELTRISSQNGVDDDIPLPFVYEHETADRWLDYKRKRLAAAARQMTLEVGTEGRNVRRGDRVTISIPVLGLIESAWEVRGCTVSPVGANALDLVPYAPSAYTYIPITAEGGALPADADFDIAPNYEKTPPNPVTGASVSYTNDLSPEGQRQVFAVVTFTPPEDNFDHAVVSIRKNGATNWEAAGSGTNRVRVPVTAGLLMDYQIVPYNVHGVRGLVETLISSSLVPGDTTVPATPTGLAGTAKLNMSEWVWNKNTEPDLAGYEYEISLTNGTVIKSGFTTDNSLIYKLTDGNLTTSATRRLRVRAKDFSGNVSGWTSQVSTASNDIERLDARNLDFGKKWLANRPNPIQVGGTGGLVEIITLNGVDRLAGQKAHIRATFDYDVNAGPGPSNPGFRIRRGTSVLGSKRISTTPVGAIGTCFLEVEDEPGAGTFAYNVQVQGPGNTYDAEAVDITLTVSESRR